MVFVIVLDEDDVVFVVGGVYASNLFECLFYIHWGILTPPATPQQLPPINIRSTHTASDLCGVVVIGRVVRVCPMLLVGLGVG
ncbi:hypothetical protein FRC0326_00692 [Corynebacterium diphtheriae]|nr:hypothetical protein FRC0326_00692 [Corynebacterium diphtheriae]